MGSIQTSFQEWKSRNAEKNIPHHFRYCYDMSCVLVMSADFLHSYSANLTAFYSTTSESSREQMYLMRFHFSNVEIELLFFLEGNWKLGKGNLVILFFIYNIWCYVRNRTRPGGNHLVAIIAADHCTFDYQFLNHR